VAVTFEVDICGRTRSISVDTMRGAALHGGLFQLDIEGQVQLVTVSLTDLGLLVVFPDGRVVDAAITERPGGDWLIQLPHLTVSALVDGRRHVRGAPSDVAIAGEQRIVAPMPGRVLRVLVKPGDQVLARQGLVVVEAMKMENELTSPKDGRVKEVAVSEGLSIDSGRLLVVVE
jgi:acetyl/propionyl-CoA carboxylase alpha subunit